MPVATFRLLLIGLLLGLATTSCTDSPTRERPIDDGRDANWHLGDDVGPDPDDSASTPSQDASSEDDAVAADTSDPLPPPAGAPAYVAVVQSTEGVLLDWGPVADAAGYEIFRDGQRITSVDANTLEYFDANADAPTPRGALTSVTATTDRGDGVLIGWTFEPAAPGTTHRYTVRALFADGPGPDSNAVEAHRVAEPVTIDVRSLTAGTPGPWRAATNTSTFLDAQAPYGTFLPGQTLASKGAFKDRIHLSILHLERTPGPDVTYEVRLTGGQRPEEISTPVTGRRGPADPRVQWERSSGAEPTGFTAVAGATSAPMADTTAPQDGTVRYYRARLSYPGSAEQLSEPDYGYRAVRCAVDANFFGQLGGPGERDGGRPTTAHLTHDANLDAIWGAAVPAPNWADPQALNPSISITGATVTAVTPRPNPQFWVEDANTGMQVYLDAPLGVALKVGQRVSFRATHVDIFNGNPQIQGLTDFTVVDADNPVPYLDVHDASLTLDDHYYRVVRIGGELGPNTSSCGDGHTCYELFYGPTGGRKVASLRSASNQLSPGRCVTFVGPAGGYLGPLSNLPDTPAIQLDTASFGWIRATDP
jgi:hypothetical protein